MFRMFKKIGPGVKHLPKTVLCVVLGLKPRMCACRANAELPSQQHIFKNTYM